MIDIFNNSAFSLNSLTLAINKLPYVPGRIASLGLFEEQGVSTLSVSIESDGNILQLVDVAPRNAPGKVVLNSKREVRSFAIPHLPERATILADEVQGVREFGTENRLRAIETVRNTRLAAMRTNLDYTLESHRLAAVKGQYIDSNGVARSLFTEFGVTQQQVDFDLDTTTTEVRLKCLDVLEKTETALDGLSFTGVRVLCGSSFWRKLLVHKSVKETYLNQSQAAALRGDAREQFEMGGLVFERYRGTSTVKIADDKAYAVPLGVNGLFITRFAPANYVETVNTLGLPLYAKAEPMPMNKGLTLEAQSNPLNLCSRPAAVIELTE